jgi:hypothetical protein
MKIVPIYVGRKLAKKITAPKIKILLKYGGIHLESDEHNFQLGLPKTTSINVD